MNGPPRKRRTREHIIADLSVNHVERQVLLGGYTLERFEYDYGTDLLMFTYNRAGEIEKDYVFFQVKASTRLNLRRGEKSFPIRIDRRDLLHWRAQMLPVILIVYDAKSGVAYWLYIQSYFQKQPGLNLFAAGKTVTVHMPLSNVLTVNAIYRFARFRDRVIAQQNEVHHDED